MCRLLAVLAIGLTAVLLSGASTPSAGLAQQESFVIIDIIAPETVSPGSEAVFDVHVQTSLPNIAAFISWTGTGEAYPTRSCCEFVSSEVASGIGHSGLMSGTFPLLVSSQAEDTVIRVVLRIADGITAKYVNVSSMVLTNILPGPREITENAGTSRVVAAADLPDLGGPPPDASDRAQTLARAGFTLIAVGAAFMIAAGGDRFARYNSNAPKGDADDPSVSALSDQGTGPCEAAVVL